MINFRLNGSTDTLTFMGDFDDHCVGAFHDQNALYNLLTLFTQLTHQELRHTVRLQDNSPGQQPPKITATWDNAFCTSHTSYQIKFGILRCGT